jgi:hypothetical protein
MHIACVVGTRRDANAQEDNVSTVTRRGKCETAAMEPTVTGNYYERSYEGYLWRCDGCGLLWTKRWHAETCESRGHKTMFKQGPYGCTGVVNGVMQGNLTWYDRVSVGREGGMTDPAERRRELDERQEMEINRDK